MHPGGPTRASSRVGYEDAGYGDGDGVEDSHDFVLAVSSDEKLLGRLNELDHSETCSTSGKGTDAKWKLEAGGVEAIRVLEMFAGAI
jgi:trehalose 6-phosphate synthase complex regulatory subunit